MRLRHLGSGHSTRLPEVGDKPMNLNRPEPLPPNRPSSKDRSEKLAGIATTVQPRRLGQPGHVPQMNIVSRDGLLDLRRKSRRRGEDQIAVPKVSEQGIRRRARVASQLRVRTTGGKGSHIGGSYSRQRPAASAQP